MDGEHERPDEPRIDERRALAWFISPHGLGHAARASAVMAACSSCSPLVTHHLFTTVPRSFFDESLSGVAFSWHRFECDVGMVQRDPLSEDVGATIKALERWLGDGESLLVRAAEQVAAADCCAVVADIAPLGLAVARAAGVPGILVENFAWDWIYRAYPETELMRYGERLSEWCDQAVLRIQAEPVCRPVDGGHPVPPISRFPRSSREGCRRRLGVRDDERVVLLSQAGGPDAGRIAALGLAQDSMRFIVPDRSLNRVVADGPLLRTPFSGAVYHPDLVYASDVVVAKLGYSTVAEAYHAGTAFAYLRRGRFPESPVLESFVREHLPSAPLRPDWLDDPAAGETLRRLAAAPRPSRPRANGAGHAAKLILSCLQHQL